ncbi:zinc finger protein 91-like [Armigeres subalbatus]|uniref:zinc finger protein 91-like n=1 Tax=Armigeres subalbatus TaxID=124917 RepID=UPI002ED3545F
MKNRKNHKQKSVEGMCRTCMTVNPAKPNRRHRKQIPIFSKFDGTLIANLITEYASVQIDENDTLPTVICAECFETIKLLVAFIKTTRNSDSKLRKLFKEEIVPVDSRMETESPVEKSPKIKSEPLEQLVNETGNDPVPEIDFEIELDNDTDSDWKGTDEETKRTVKREKLGLKSKPKPRKRIAKPLPKKQPIQNEESQTLNEEEKLLFTVIEVSSGSHICCGCLHIFNTFQELDVHRQTLHAKREGNPSRPCKKKIVCDGCQRKYDSQRSVNFHKDRVQLLKTVWECNKCKLRFKVAGKRREHLRIHPEDEPVALIARVKETTKQEFGWVCCATKCGESFTNEQDLIEHSQGAHWIDKQEADLENPDLPEQCQVCFRRFADKRKIINHQRRKYKRLNYQCALCGLKFTTPDGLNMHDAKEHGGGSVFMCKICDKTFTRESTMIKHVNTIHTDEKPHQCTVCGMTFRQKSGLKIHMSNHVEVPQYKCEVCLKMFKAKLHLRYHMRTHTGERPYKCRFCDHAFANHTNFRRHEMTHTGEKPHKCSYCEKSFILKRTMLEHETTHTGKPFTRDERIKCEICEQRFGKSSSLVLHMASAHPDMIDVQSSDEDSNQKPITIPNVPVTIRVVSPAVPPPVTAVLQPVQQQMPTIINTAAVGTSPATVAVYNVVPSSAPGSYGTYILKF